MPECVPVYERTGGHVYKSVYPGPIGAILTPQLKGIEDDGVASLPYASSLCCACYEVCPVKIDIPKVLVHQRGKIVDEKKRRGNLKARLDPEHVGMKWMARVFRDPKKYERAQKIAQTGQKIFVRDGTISKLPGQLSGWTAMRDLKPRLVFKN